jgi:hypothetical protein
LSEDVLKKFIVQKASQEEIQEDETEEEASTEDRIRPTVRRRIDFRRIEELAINKFLSDRDFEGYNFIKEAKLVTQFHGIDSISNIQPIFDGYINRGEEEVFIEVRPTLSHLMMWRERVYLMLNKINLYRSVKKVNTYLALILVDIPEGVSDRPSSRNPERIVENLKEFFEPAITSGLLRVTRISLSIDEAESIMREVR